MDIQLAVRKLICIDFIDISMNCGECKLRFNQSERRPIISECGHTVCESCRTTSVACPKCKRKMDKNKWIILESKAFEVDMLVKLCFVGDIGVGKSCLILRLCKESFPESIDSTIGLDFRVIDTDINGVNFRFQLWDTAGQERFEAIYTKTYRDADIAVIVIDISDTEKFRAEKYEKLIEDKCKPDVKRIYVQNKIDLVTSFQKLENYHYTSCKNNQGVSQLWDEIVQKSLSIPKESIKFKKPDQRQLATLPRRGGQQTRREQDEGQKQKQCCSTF